MTQPREPLSVGVALIAAVLLSNGTAQAASSEAFQRYQGAHAECRIFAAEKHIEDARFDNYINDCLLLRGFTVADQKRLISEDAERQVQNDEWLRQANAELVKREQCKSDPKCVQWWPDDTAKPTDLDKRSVDAFLKTLKPITKPEVKQ